MAPGTAMGGMNPMGMPGTAQMMPPGTAMRLPGGMAPPTAMRMPGTAMPGTAMGGGMPPGTGMAPGTAMRLGTGMMVPPGTGDVGERPMTSVQAAGYNSDPSTRVGQQFDPSGMAGASRGPAPPLQKKSESSTEEKLKDMERQVNALIEESAFEAAKGDAGTPAALEKAKEAAKKERVLCKQREAAGLVDQINIDLTYSVCFNLANQYHANKQYTEALNTYSLIVKNKQYAQAGRLRVNMGNIYYEQKKYPMAVKMYRMALDQIPNTTKELRFKIMRNIGHASFRMGAYQDALHSYEEIMEGNPDFQAGFDLLLCYYALGDKERMKKGFLHLMSVEHEGTENEEDEDLEIDPAQHDVLKEELREREKQGKHFVTVAGKLIAPVIELEWVSGFDWVLDNLKTQGHDDIASEMEIHKAVTYMHKKDFGQAVEVLKGFEKKDKGLMARAATNLSFIYFLEGDNPAAKKYAEMAHKYDRYNAKALVNLGNVQYANGEFEAAAETFQEAAEKDSDCVEAIYNQGLAYKALEQLDEAKRCFEKLQTIMPMNAEVIYNIANLHDAMGNMRQATKWFNILTTRVPSDPGILARLGQIYSREEDEAQAFHYHLEAYRYFPVNMEVISWLGAYFVKNELYEKAMEFFKRASQIQPEEVKWKLMVASCHRRIQNFSNALQIYQDIHNQYPENVECLRYLVHICGEQGMKEQAHEYVLKLRKAERDMEIENARKERQEQERQAMEQERDGGGGDSYGGEPKQSQYEEQPQQQEAYQPPVQQQQQQQQQPQYEQPPQQQPYGGQPSPQQQQEPSPQNSPMQPSPQRKQAADDEWGDDDDVAGLLA
jgi:intraflagellar transport protein 88